MKRRAGVAVDVKVIEFRVRMSSFLCSQTILKRNLRVRTRKYILLFFFPPCPFPQLRVFPLVLVRVASDGVHLILVRSLDGCVLN